MSKKSYVIRRIGQLVILYLAIGTMLFFLFRLSPGSPLSQFVGGSFTEAQAESIRQRFGLADPLHIQYLKFLRNILLFDFGRSYQTGLPVIEMIADRFWNTVVLMFTAIILAYAIGVPFGAYLAWFRGTKRERFGVIIALVARSAPVFWTGILVLWIFAVKLGWFPAGSMTSAGVEYESKLGMYTSVDFLRHLVLPALTLAAYYLSLPTLLMRNTMLEVINEEYVQFADIKGASDRRIMLKHAGRNSLLPIVTAFAIATGHAVGGSVLIETVFAWPGLGRMMVQSVVGNDYPVAQGAFLLLAGLVLIANFLADLAYGYLDPRITYE